MTIEESKVMWNLEVENNKPLYGSFSKEMKRLYNKVDELINEGVITYEDFTNDVIDSITTTIVDNGKNNAEPSRALAYPCLSLLGLLCSCIPTSDKGGQIHLLYPWLQSLQNISFFH